jgi:glutamine amidotransferase
MSIPVTIVDYGIGNLLNVVRAFEHCGASVRLVDRAGPGVEAERLVLPGVGAFGDGMAELRARGLDQLVLRFAETGRPFLGICVGLQMMFESSDELGRHLGLGLLAGQVRAVAAQGRDGQPHRVPHIGWRPLLPASAWQGTPLADLRSHDRVYFVHSFTAEPKDEAVRLADVDYGGLRLCAAVRQGNLYGCQFHPERSGPAGLAMLRRFLKL